MTCIDKLLELPSLFVCSNEKRLRLTGLVKAYYHQLKTGCNVKGCENRKCRGSGEGFEYLADDDQSLFNTSRLLTRGAFQENPVFYFCSNYCYPTTAWKSQMMGSNVLEEINSISETEQTALLAAHLDIESAPWMLLSTECLKRGVDIYDDNSSLPLGSVENGGSIGLDLPLVRKTIRKLSESSIFESHITSLLHVAKDCSTTSWPETLSSETTLLEGCSTFGSKLLNNCLAWRLTRLFVLLLECPAVRDNHNNLTECCAVIASVHKHVSDPLVGVFSNYSEEAIKPIIQGMLSFITMTLMQEPQDEEGRLSDKLPGACIVLSILYEANFKVKKSGIVPHTMFYNEELNEEVNGKYEFDKWKVEEIAKEKEAKSPPKKGLSWRSLNQLFLQASRRGRTHQYAELLDKPDKDPLFTFVSYPFLLNAAYKHSLLHYDSRFQQNREMRRSVIHRAREQGVFTMSVESLYLILDIDRQDLIGTALQGLNRNKDKVRHPLRVQFKNEEGIDEGGVKKEFFQLLIRQLVDPGFGMFTENSDTNVHWFQPRLVCSTNDIEFFLIGQLVGIAIYNNVILDINFPSVCFKKLLGIEPELADLQGIDSQLHKSLSTLLAYDEEAEGVSIEDCFCLSFMVTHEVFGESVDVELKENGTNVLVTKENRQEYVDLYCKYIHTDSIGKNFKEFSDGFFQVCGNQIELLEVFHPQELENIVVGCPVFDLAELEETTRYDGYTQDDNIIKEFWCVIRSMDNQQQKMFLKFCTGTDRLPIRGLKSLGFVIGKNGGDSEQLPTAHTCFNHLLIPTYDNPEKLREKLFKAINNCQGFGLM